MATGSQEPEAPAGRIERLSDSKHRAWPAPTGDGDVAWHPAIEQSGEPATPDADVTPAYRGPAPPPEHRPLARGVRRSVFLVVLAALVGAASATIVARATGWGSQTVIQRFSGLPTSVIGTHRADVPAILRRILPGVAAITATSGFAGTSSGTGIVITKGGEVVTNAHVVEGAQSIVVTLGDTQDYAARLVGILPERDLALLQVVGAHGLSPVQLGNSANMVVGDDVLTIGYALGLSGGPSVTEGIISAKNREVGSDTSDGTPFLLRGLLQTDAAISSGNSGGPLVNAAAQVVGINTIVAASSSDVTAQNIGFAISSNTLKALLPQLRGG